VKLDPLVAGAGAGLLAALLLAPATGDALGRLADARAEQAQLVTAVAEAKRPASALVTPGLAVADALALAVRIRERAKAGGVLVEQAEPLGSDRLALVRLRLSGPEKSVIAMIDALEREAPLVRLQWQLTALPGGGVRLSGEAVAARR